MNYNNNINNESELSNSQQLQCTPDVKKQEELGRTPLILSTPGELSTRKLINDESIVQLDRKQSVQPQSPSRQPISSGDVVMMEEFQQLSQFTQLLRNLQVKLVIKRFLNSLRTHIYPKLSNKHYMLINDSASVHHAHHSQIDRQKVLPVFSSMLHRYDTALNRHDTIKGSKGKGSRGSNIGGRRQSTIRQDILQRLETLKRESNCCWARLEESKNVKKVSKWLEQSFGRLPVFSPNSNYKLLWDFLQLIVTVIFMFFIPIHIIFEYDFQSLMGVELACIGPILLLADNVYYLNTGIYDKGVLITNRRHIFKFWVKHMLFNNFISTLPLSFSIFASLARGESSTDANNNNFIMQTKYLLLLFVFKMDTHKKVINKLQETYVQSLRFNNTINLVKLLFFIQFMGHVVASVFLFSGIQEKQLGHNNWLKSKDIHNENWQIQYLYSYYCIASINLIFNMLTIGYGDVTPITASEMLICVFLMYISCGVFGYTLNAINQIFDAFYRIENERKKKLIVINNYMKKKNVNKSLQSEVREYLDYAWRENQEEAENEEQILSQLSEVLHEKLLLEANKIVLKDSRVFKKNFSEAVIQKTVALIKEQKLTPNEKIFTPAERDDCAIYFIERGAVEIYMEYKVRGSKAPASVSLQVFRKGQSFGEFSFFTGQPRAQRMRSTEFTTLLIIRRSDFLQLLMDYTEDYEKFAFIKDQILFNHRIDLVAEQCLSCDERSHYITDCPFLHFIFRRQQVIARYNFTCHQDRRDRYVRKKYTYRAIKDIDRTAEKLQEYQKANGECLDNYERKNQLELDELLSQISSSDDDDEDDEDESEDQEEEDEEGDQYNDDEELSSKGSGPNKNNKEDEDDFSNDSDSNKNQVNTNISSSKDNSTENDVLSIGKKHARTTNNDNTLNKFPSYYNNNNPRGSLTQQIDSSDCSSIRIDAAYQDYSQDDTVLRYNQSLVSGIQAESQASQSQSPQQKWRRNSVQQNRQSIQSIPKIGEIKEENEELSSSSECSQTPTSGFQGMHCSIKLQELIDSKEEPSSAQKPQQNKGGLVNTSSQVDAPLIFNQNEDQKTPPSLQQHYLQSITAIGQNKLQQASDHDPSSKVDQQQQPSQVQDPQISNQKSKERYHTIEKTQNRSYSNGSYPNNEIDCFNNINYFEAMEKQEEIDIMQWSIQMEETNQNKQNKIKNINNQTKEDTDNILKINDSNQPGQFLQSVKLEDSFEYFDKEEQVEVAANNEGENDGKGNGQVHRNSNRHGTRKSSNKTDRDNGGEQKQKSKSIHAAPTINLCEVNSEKPILSQQFQVITRSPRQQYLQTDTIIEGNVNKSPKAINSPREGSPKRTSLKNQISIENNSKKIDSEQKKQLLLQRRRSSRRTATFAINSNISAISHHLDKGLQNLQRKCSFQVKPISPRTNKKQARKSMMMSEDINKASNVSKSINCPNNFSSYLFQQQQQQGQQQQQQQYNQLYGLNSPKIRRLSTMQYKIPETQQQQQQTPLGNPPLVGIGGGTKRMSNFNQMHQNIAFTQQGSSNRNSQFMQNNEEITHMKQKENNQQIQTAQQIKFLQQQLMQNQQNVQADNNDAVVGANNGGVMGHRPGLYIEKLLQTQKDQTLVRINEFYKLLDFDQMKVFQIYYPNNNWPEVLKHLNQKRIRNKKINMKNNTNKKLRNQSRLMLIGNFLKNRKTSIMDNQFKSKLGSASKKGTININDSMLSQKQLDYQIQIIQDKRRVSEKVIPNQPTGEQLLNANQSGQRARSFRLESGQKLIEQ